MPLNFSQLSMIAAIFLSLAWCTLLPIPARAQSGDGTLVQFPASSSSCVACQPAFASSACQTILNSISQGSSNPISNATLASCQCSSTFLSLYSSCVQCFQDTNQVSLVFGSSQAPTQASLQTYCNAVNPQGTTTTTTVTTVTVTKTSGSGKPTSTSNPSSAMILRVTPEGQRWTVLYSVLAAAVLGYMVMLS
ncbi:hypothetical protein EMPS_08592 [Entomortierella parvispora]|uniref:Uncharacterized protein n=1 Tax=Entomortierella parvispora TaxID=205924 RepID=A0A9P3HGZ8_9FUNG|nr:hypothetical protein EMPS_08592 [Entomortierella parvispora]